MKCQISEAVKYFNRYLHRNNKKIIYALNSYIHSSCRYTKQTYGEWISFQPAWPEHTVIGYKYYSDKEFAYNHKTNRLMLTFSDNSQYDISVYKFKRYLRRMWPYFEFNRFKTDEKG